MLYVVATPIGNLEDITLRAIRILKESHFILAEDTRESAKLMHKYEIVTPMVSYRDQNHKRMVVKVLEKLEMGLNLCLISDAGTPTISDPGYKLIHEVKAAGYEVIPIPGPSAVIAAMSASGLPTDRFTFLGFLPKSDSKILSILKKYMADEASLIIYESPARLVDLLKIISEIDPERNVSVANDITKLKEAIDFGKAVDIYKKWFEKKDHIKGEFVVSISKSL